MTEKNNELSSINIERWTNIILIIINIIFIVLNYGQTKRSNDINELSQIRSYDIEETKLNLDLLNSFVIDLQNSQQYIDKILESSNNLNYNSTKLDEIEGSTQNIFNSIRTKLDNENKYSNELDESFTYEIDGVLKGIENIRKLKELYESENGKNVRRGPLVKTGYTPKLEDIFIKYKNEELNLMINKLDINNK